IAFCVRLGLWMFTVVSTSDTSSLSQTNLTAYDQILTPVAFAIPGTANIAAAIAAEQTLANPFGSLLMMLSLALVGDLRISPQSPAGGSEHRPGSSYVNDRFMTLRERCRAQSDYVNSRVARDIQSSAREEFSQAGSSLSMPPM